MSGWIKVSRKVAGSDLWLSEPFSRGQAWIDLLLIANYKDGFIRVAGQRIEVKRGQCGWSQVKLSERWKWSRGKTERFIKELESDGKIGLKTSNRNTIITICKYEQYQGIDTPDRTPVEATDRTSDGHQTGSRQGTKEEEIKKKKKGNIIPKPDSVDDQVWKDFLAHRKSKKAILTQTTLSNYEKEAVKAGITLQEALETMINRGWQGFQAEWVTKGHHHARNATKTSEPTGHAAHYAIGEAARRILERGEADTRPVTEVLDFEPTGLLSDYAQRH